MKDLIEPELFYKDFRVVRINSYENMPITAFWPNNFNLPGIHLFGDYTKHSRAAAEQGFEACRAWFLTMARLTGGRILDL